MQILDSKLLKAENHHQAVIMNAFEENRRSFLINVGALVTSQVLSKRTTEAQTPARERYLLGATEGEHLVHFRDRGKILIKVGSATGSDNVAAGTQQVMVGTGIPIHRHLQMDEAFYVLDGSGMFILNDERHGFERGATIFIPKNTWHGFANPDHELLLLWVVSPAGLDGFFRDTCSPPGVPPRQLTRQQINEIARKYATEFR
jgi:quercetin dioxygenase-like cupin family protein